MLGSSIATRLSSASGVELLPWYRETGDLRDAHRVKTEFARLKPDLVIHCAAKVGGIHANIAEPYTYLSDNLMLDQSVTQASLAADVKQFLYIGSSCMYPRDYRQPLVEGDILGGPLEPTNEGYALSKISGSLAMAYASKQFSVDYRTIVASNLYGPGDNFAVESSHLVAAALRKAHFAKIKGDSTIEIWGDGKARREFTYVGDVANWICENLREIPNFPSVMNLGFGSDFSVSDYYKFAAEAVGFTGGFSFDNSKPTGMAQKLMDSTIARDNFRWTPTTHPLDGMKLTYEDYKDKQ
jgi:GDP-L-fucose synthase